MYFEKHLRFDPRLAAVIVVVVQYDFRTLGMHTMSSKFVFRKKCLLRNISDSTELAARWWLVLYDGMESKYGVCVIVRSLYVESMDRVLF